MAVDRDLAASFAASAWIALVQVAFIPVYIDLLGVEAYGLIGVYAVLQSALVVLDLGFTPTLNREAARAGADRAGLRTLLRSVEIVLAAVAVVVVASALVLAPAFVRDWLRLEGMAVASAARAVELMAALVAVRLFIGAHRGLIAGSQRLVWLNGAGALFATLRSVGVVPLLWLRPSIEAFFAWQLAVTLLEAALTARHAWRLIRGPARAAFSPAALRAVGGYSGGLATVTLVSLALTQADKVLLSAMVPLAAFGHYALAAAVASALLLAMGPVGSVAYPRLNRLAAAGSAPALAAAFHEHAGRMTLAVAPPAMALAFYAEPLLRLWTRDPATSAASAGLLVLLALGTMLNAFVYVPYVLAFAHGRSGRVAAASAGLLAAFLAALYAGIDAYGALGAAACWLAVNAAGVAVAFAIAADLPAGSRWRWFVADVLAPTAAAAAAAALVRLLFAQALADGGLAAGASIALGGMAALGAALVARRITWSRA